MRFIRKGPTAGHPRAFEEVVSEYLDVLYGASLRLCSGRRADAEDLLQDAMLQAFEHYAELREPAAARAWMFTILTRTNLNRLRARRRRAEMLTADIGEQEFEQALASWWSVETPDAHAELALTRVDLSRALDALDEQLRPVVWLSDVEGFRQREVAEMLGIPEGTVASRLFRARRSLREMLQQLAPPLGARGPA